ncbi:hypothetical protein IAG41_22545 [Sphingomonas sp. JC676]|uniref:response regulator transcription factor n=1 Tax=Sphingomonas sp. JC676 TaxID=2768065 RepID=UPI001657AAF3|nr:LuxR C-terminal-related transcriptional regulator [Sphingomonas sp. JC676]MBC9035179.1 hypothetical protein [Sphingomonas sp. JC676]
MLVQSAERKATKFSGRSLGTPETIDRSVEGSGGPDRTKSDPAPRADTDRNAAYARLAQQCRSRVDSLAPRQRDVLAGLVAGCTNKQIALMLGISPRTIEIHRAGMMGRLKARTLAQALHIAFVAGLVPCETMSLGTG